MPDEPYLWATQTADFPKPYVKWTAAQHRLPITFVILNNQEYAALKSFSCTFNTTEFTGVDLPGIDMCAIATGYGCDTLRVERADDLAAALTGSFNSSGPVVIDVVVDHAAITLY